MRTCRTIRQGFLPGRNVDHGACSPFGHRRYEKASLPPNLPRSGPNFWGRRRQRDAPGKAGLRFGCDQVRRPPARHPRRKRSRVSPEQNLTAFTRRIYVVLGLGISPKGGLAVSISTRESRGYRFEPQPGVIRAKPGSTTVARLYGAHFQKGNLPVGLPFYWKNCASAEVPAKWPISTIRPPSIGKNISKYEHLYRTAAGLMSDGYEGTPDRIRPRYPTGVLLLSGGWPCGPRGVSVYSVRTLLFAVPPHP